jgi:hypothetical protein
MRTSETTIVCETFVSVVKPSVFHKEPVAIDVAVVIVLATYIIIVAVIDVVVVVVGIIGMVVILGIGIANVMAVADPIRVGISMSTVHVESETKT